MFTNSVNGHDSLSVLVFICSGFYHHKFTLLFSNAQKGKLLCLLSIKTMKFIHPIALNLDHDWKLMYILHPMKNVFIHSLVMAVRTVFQFRIIYE